MQTYNEVIREYIINKGNDLLNKECESVIKKEWDTAYKEIQMFHFESTKSDRREEYQEFKREQKKKYEELLKGSYEEKLKVVLNDFYGKEVIKNTYFGDFKEKKKVDWIYILLLVVSMVKNVLEVEFMREV